MSNPITSVTQAPPVPTAAQTPAAAAKPAAAPAPAQKTPTDTVAISNSAQTILQEAQETRAQTVQEANSGDSQARRLLAKETPAAATPKA